MFNERFFYGLVVGAHLEMIIKLTPRLKNSVARNVAAQPCVRMVVLCQLLSQTKIVIDSLVFHAFICSWHLTTGYPEQLKINSGNIILIWCLKNFTSGSV